MGIPTGINVNKRNRVEKMTEQEVKALIQELKDEIPAIHKKLHKELEEKHEKQWGDYQKEQSKKEK